MTNKQLQAIKNLRAVKHVRVVDSIIEKNKELKDKEIFHVKMINKTSDLTVKEASELIQLLINSPLSDTIRYPNGKFEKRNKTGWSNEDADFNGFVFGDFC